MKKNGYLIVNGFLDEAKFLELYSALDERAKKRGLGLEIRPNTSLMCEAGSLRPLCGEPLPSFALFWDKDVRLARELEALGMRLFNPSSAIELCDDKALTHIALARKLPMPRTVVVPLAFPRVGYTNTRFLEAIADELGFPFIIKQCFGSFGAEVYLARNMDEALHLLEVTRGQPIIAQEFIRSSAGRDLRVYVVGGKARAAILRENLSGDFRANVARGAAVTPYKLNDEQRLAAESAADILGLDFAGVDLLFAPDSSPLLCEVNSNAHFAGISAATGVDIAAAIIDAVVEGTKG